jgi:acetyltransferase
MLNREGTMMPTSQPDGYPAHHESRYTLRNGSEVFVRPILPSDGHLLVDLFNRISPQSRYYRFLSNMPALTEQMLHRFTHVDYDKEFALVALVKEDGVDTIIAVGRYSLEPPEEIADLAVTVRDDWQHFGLGKALLGKIIAIGKEHGIPRFGSMLAPQNTVIRRILVELGYEVKFSLHNGFFQVEIVA